MTRVRARSGKNVLRVALWTTPQLDRGVDDYARKAGWAMEFFRLWLTPPEQLVSYVGQLKPDGLLISGLPAPIRAELVKSAPIPAVEVAGSVGNTCGQSVVLDDVAIGRLAGKHLVERGFRHFAFGTLLPHPVSALRQRGFQEATEAVADTFFSIGVKLDSSGGPQEYLRRFRREIIHLPKPLGLMTMNDYLARRLARACEQEGVLVPEQVAIVGVDNEPQDDLADVPLSSVDPNFHACGFEGARLLDSLMDGKPGPKEVRKVPPEAVVERASTRILAVDHVGVARALHFILSEYADSDSDLQLKQIASVAGLSTRQLQSVFSDAMGCPVAEYIRRLRLDRAKDLLLDTDQPIGEIATASGYKGTAQLSAHLRSETGLGPREWRKRHQTRM